MKVNSEKKKLIIKMVTSVIIVIAGLFQKQADSEDTRKSDEDDYLF